MLRASLGFEAAAFADGLEVTRLGEVLVVHVVHLVGEAHGLQAPGPGSGTDRKDDVDRVVRPRGGIALEEF